MFRWVCRSGCPPAGTRQMSRMAAFASQVEANGRVLPAVFGAYLVGSSAVLVLTSVRMPFIDSAVDVFGKVAKPISQHPAQGHPAYIEGTPRTAVVVADPTTGYGDEDILTLTRVVEMYVRVAKRLPNGEIATTTGWVSKPTESPDPSKPNPAWPETLKNELISAPARINGVIAPKDLVKDLPQTKVVLTESSCPRAKQVGLALHDGHLYTAGGTPTQPKVGDVRVMYLETRTERMVLFGARAGDSVGKFEGKLAELVPVPAPKDYWPMAVVMFGEEYSRLNSPISCYGLLPAKNIKDAVAQHSTETKRKEIQHPIHLMAISGCMTVFGSFLLSTVAMASSGGLLPYSVAASASLVGGVCLTVYEIRTAQLSVGQEPRVWKALDEYMPPELR